MSLLSENVIPRNHEKIFETNAKEKTWLEKIKSILIHLKRIKDVLISTEIYPKELTVHTSTLVKIEDIEEKVKQIGFYEISKGLFKR